MMIKKPVPLREATVLTMLIFSALLSVWGILGLVEQERKEDPPSVYSEHEPAVEVLGILPQEIPSRIFENFLPPVTGKITSAYGYRKDPFTGENSYHRGVDVAVAEGTEVLAAQSGTVKASAYDDVGGNYVILSHENGTESYYGHLRTRTVAKGDQVGQGDVIGLSGATGSVTGPHLHFQLTYGQRTVDPTKYLDLSHEED